MPRRSYSLCCAAVLALAGFVSARGQDSRAVPSLGEVARETRTLTSGAGPHRVITNDDVSSNAWTGVLGAKATTDRGGGSGSGEQASSSQDLDKAEAEITALERMSQVALVKLALQGSDVNFPGRATWEVRLVSAKEDYVAQVRDLLRQARQLEVDGKRLAASATGQGATNENDPAVTQYNERFKELTQNAVRIDVAFQAVITEGRNRASEAAHK